MIEIEEDLQEENRYKNLRRVANLIPQEISFVKFRGVKKAKFVFRRNGKVMELERGLQEAVGELIKLVEALIEKGEATADDLELLKELVAGVVGELPKEEEEMPEEAQEEERAAEPEEAPAPEVKEPEGNEEIGMLKENMKSLQDSVSELKEITTGLVEIMEAKNV